MDREKEFHKYVYWLGDSIPVHMQDEAYNYFINDCKDEYIPHIICPQNPFTWNNAINIIKKFGYPKNKLAIDGIMYLFQDINWKFSQTALFVTKEIYSNDPDIVIEAIEKAARLADISNDIEWLYGLSWLKEKLKIRKDCFNDSEIIKILYKSEYWDNPFEIL